MTINTDIKFYINTNTNAPQLTNNFGCMLNVLDACLVNGFSSQTISSLTYSNNIATATFASAHNFMQYQVIKIIGATQAEYNIETRILTVPDSTTITFKLFSIPSVTTATGTISCSLPPLDWEKPFSSTSATGGKGAYRSKNILLSNRPYLRVVDELDPAYTSTYAKYAKVGIVEDMTDIDTMLGVQAPYDSTNPNKNWVGSGSGATAVNGWSKWYYARNDNAHSTSTLDTSTPPTNNRSWVLVGTKDYFYILPSQTGSGSAFPYGFGNFTSFLNTDNSNTFLSSTLMYGAANTTSMLYYNISLGISDYQTTYLLLYKNYTQSANYSTASCISLQVRNSMINSGTTNYIGAYSLTNVAPFSSVMINEAVLRGELQNIYYLFQAKPYLNSQLIEKNNFTYMARNIFGAGIEGQIIIKIGEV